MRFLLTTWRHWQRLVDGLCKQRTATAECVNEQTRNRRLLRTPVRGLAKVRCMLGLFVLAQNLMYMAKPAPHLVGWAVDPSNIGAKGA